MLPLLRGYGEVPHLHIAMSQDPALLSRAQTLVAQGFSGSSNLVTEVEQLIIHWTGSEDVVPDSHGEFVDARKLSVLEAFMAAPFVTNQGITDPGGNHAEQINLAWEELRTGILQRLVAQDLRGSPLSGATYEFATDTLGIGGALSDFIESAKTQQPADSSDAIAYWHNIADFLRLSAGTLGVTEDAIEASLETGLADTELGHFSPVLFQPHLGGSTNPDTLHSGNYYNLLTAGNGNDQLVSSGTGYLALFGGAGDDELASEPFVAPATRFVGGTGQDTLIGSRYADTYYFNPGDGNDLIDETAGGFSSHQDRLYFGPGITREDVSVTRDDLDLIFDVGSSGDSIRVKEWYDLPGINGSDHRIESVVFEDSIWQVDDIHTTGLEVHGTVGDDILSTLPFVEGNILHGEGGNDTLSAGPGSSDILHGGDGDDLLLGGDVSSDYLYGGAGNDELRSQPMNAFPTHLSGGTGDDLLVGSRYADTYYFNPGDGNDLIDETAGGFSSHQDRLYFGPGITREDVSVTRDDLDLIFDVGSSGDSIRVKEWYDLPGINGSDHRIESVVFEDSIWQVDDIHTTGLEVHGTVGDDILSTLPFVEGNILHGEGGNDTLSAGPGSSDILHGGDGDDLLLGGDVSSDYLYGGAGNDELRSQPMNAFPTHLSGGTGDDLLVGSRYADTYYFNPGDGNDLIDETAGGFSSHQDRLYFGPGITREAVSVTRDDLDLIFDVGSNGDSIRVKEWYDRPGINGGDRRIESVILDNRIWSAEEIEDLAVENHPPNLNNPLADVSTLSLVPFEMTLDETMFSDIDQQAPLSLTVSRASSLPLPAWLTFDSELRRLSGTPSLADLQTMELVVTATDESYFSVSDSFDLTVSLPSGSVIAGTPQDDFVVGSSLDDVFVHDTLSGGDGDDSFVALGPDLGVNIIDGGSGFDMIKAGLGDDIIRVDSLQPENSVELIDGGSGVDILAGTSAAQTINLSQTTLVGIEKIDAAGGADVVISSSGDDIIVGGSGNDTLHGAGGDDQFLIRKYQGVDLFNGGEGVDSIVGTSPTRYLSSENSLPPTQSRLSTAGKDSTQYSARARTRHSIFPPRC